jgi:hypothetical protein
MTGYFILASAVGVMGGFFVWMVYSSTKHEREIDRLMSEPIVPPKPGLTQPHSA